jgi:hypothetical protein
MEICLSCESTLCVFRAHPSMAGTRFDYVHNKSMQTPLPRVIEARDRNDWLGAAKVRVENQGFRSSCLQPHLLALRQAIKRRRGSKTPGGS